MTTTRTRIGGTPAGKEATMAETTTQTIARLRANGWTARRILSGLGHPGYGEKFAVAALAKCERYDMTAHEAVYGGLTADRKRYAIDGR
jgi:hypothetical protein